MARGRLSGKSLPPFAAEQIFALLGERCVYCGIKHGEKNKAQLVITRFVIEHVVPVVRGGLAVPENLTVACHSCNCRKRSMTAAEFGFASVPTWANPTDPTVRWSDPEMSY